MLLETLRRQFEDRAEEGDGQFAIAVALMHLADKIGYLSFNSPDGQHPGALEFIGIHLKDLAENAGHIASELANRDD